MLKFTRVPTLAFTLSCIFWSKSGVVFLRCFSLMEGLSMLRWVMPNSSSADPCVLICTPPGPNILSAGPMSNFMSVMENFSSLLFSPVPFFSRQ